jgi:hypothetical protein
MSSPEIERKVKEVLSSWGWSDKYNINHRGYRNATIEATIEVMKMYGINY